MSDDTISKTEVTFDKPPKLSKEEKARLDGLTDQDIVNTAETDPDNPVLTSTDLQDFKTIAEAKQIRKALKLTQESFSEIFNIPIGTVRDWEQHRTEPDKAAQNYLEIVRYSPEMVIEALSKIKIKEPIER